LLDLSKARVKYIGGTGVRNGTFANPQTFTIGALLPANLQDVWLNNAFVILASGFTGGGAGQYTSPAASLVYPATSDSVGYIVVNANGSVPEPGCVAFSAVAAALLRHRRHPR
jgi:hypothetical protein